MSDDLYPATRDQMLVEFPNAFGTLETPKPLKVGIREDLAEILDDEALTRFLIRWTSLREYKLALSKGGPRYDLQGKPCGAVTAEERELAMTPLARLILRRMNARPGSAHVLGRSALNDPAIDAFRNDLILLMDRMARQQWKKAHKHWPCNVMHKLVPAAA